MPQQPDISLAEARAAPHRGSEEDERAVADLEFRVQQERETFLLYERRRIDYESQATALTAAALTLAALLVAGSDKLIALGTAPRFGLSVALVALVVAMLCAAIARFSSWGAATRLGHREPRNLTVGDSLEAMRNPGDISAAELRELALRHWHARALSAWDLGDFKVKWLTYAAFAFAAPIVFLLVVAVALVI